MEALPPVETPRHEDVLEALSVKAEAFRASIAKLELLAPDEVAGWIRPDHTPAQQEVYRKVIAHVTGEVLTEDASQEACNKYRAALQDAVPMLRAAVRSFR